MGAQASGTLDEVVADTSTIEEFDQRVASFAETKFRGDGIEVNTGLRVVKVYDDLITMKSKSAGEISMPYGMAVWSAGIGTHPVIMDFMHQIGQVVKFK
ncbi:hypothetical protein ABZP36_011454 [Zizania latifolia]